MSYRRLRKAVSATLTQASLEGAWARAASVAVGGTDSAAALACGWIGLAQDNYALFSKPPSTC